MRDLFLRALRKEKVERPPVWLMRQAGRYMPDYQQIRSRHSLYEMFHNPSLAAEVTLLPIKLLDVDAAIIFSDILVLAKAFGKKLVFPEAGGPYVTPFITTASDIASLQREPVEDALGFVQKTIDLVKPELGVPLIGFCGGPFTLASYMVEGAGRAGFRQTLSLLSELPEYFHMLLEKITDASIEYLKMQARSGVDAVQLFDSWASVLNEEQFRMFCLPYWQKIAYAMHVQGVPLIAFCRDSHRFASDICCVRELSAISIDEKGSLPHVRSIVGPHLTLQGNMSAEFLRDASRDMVIKETQDLLGSMHKDPSYIVNLGHGVLPATPLENVKVFVQTVKESISFRE